MIIQVNPRETKADRYRLWEPATFFLKRLRSVPIGGILNKQDLFKKTAFEGKDDVI